MARPVRVGVEVQLPITVEVPLHLHELISHRQDAVPLILTTITVRVVLIRTVLRLLAVLLSLPVAVAVLVHRVVEVPFVRVEVPAVEDNTIDKFVDFNRWKI